MVRGVTKVAAVLVLIVGGWIGCSSGLSAEASKTRCDQEKSANAGNGCYTDAVYASCLSCYEQCGDSCAVSESCPVAYTCSGASSSGGGTSSATGSGTTGTGSSAH